MGEREKGAGGEGVGGINFQSILFKIVDRPRPDWVVYHNTAIRFCQFLYDRTGSSSFWTDELYKAILKNTQVIAVKTSLSSHSL